MERQDRQAVGTAALNAPTTPIATDALVIGAGPAGLFLAFQLGLLEIRCHIVDSLPAAGGQCIALYPDKPIYDIPAITACTGRELTERLLAQVRPMAPVFHLSQQVSRLSATTDGCFEVDTTTGTRFLARSVFIAGGVGSFVPRQLALDGLAQHAGRQVLHSGDAIPATAGQHVIVLGDDSAALETVLALSAQDVGRPASVTLMHRRDAFKAETPLVEQMRAACAAGRMQFIAGQAVGFETQGDRLTQLHICHADGHTATLPADLLLVLWGLSPKLGPIAEWGLQIERKQLVVDSEKFETSLPGIYAIGDVNTYPGKKRLIVCGFHEATMAAYAAAARLRPEHPIQLQYTTTSSRLHQLLGVTPSG